MKKIRWQYQLAVSALGLLTIGSLVLFGIGIAKDGKKVVTKPLVTCLYQTTTVFDEIANKAVLSGNTITLYRANGSIMQFINVSCRVLYPTKDGQYK